LEVDARDNRRPLFDLPSNISFQKAFEMDTKLPFELQSPPFDEFTMFKHWYDREGHYEFVSVQFVPGSCKTVTKSMNIDWNFNNQSSSTTANVEPAFAPLLEPVTPRTMELAAFDTKSNSVQENFWIVMVCGVASFCRKLEINVNAAGYIGPLMDAHASFHKDAGSYLENYQTLNIWEILGCRFSGHH
jgi:hypothetical protein